MKDFKMSKLIIVLICVIIPQITISDINLQNNVFLGKRNEEKKGNVSISNNISNTPQINEYIKSLEEDLATAKKIFQNIQIAYDSKALTVDFVKLKEIKSKLIDVDFTNSSLKDTEFRERYESAMSKISTFKSLKDIIKKQKEQEQQTNTKSSDKAENQTLTSSNYEDEQLMVHNIRTDQDISLFSMSTFIYNMQQASRLQINFFKELTEENIDDLAYSLKNLEYIRELRLYYGKTKNADSLKYLFNGISNFKLFILDISDFTFSKVSFEGLLTNLALSSSTLRVFRANLDKASPSTTVNYTRLTSFLKSCTYLVEVDLGGFKLSSDEINTLVNQYFESDVFAFTFENMNLTNENVESIISKIVSSNEKIEYIGFRNNSQVLLNDKLYSLIKSVIDRTNNTIKVIDFSLNTTREVSEKFKSLVNAAAEVGVKLDL